ncbi:MAG: thiamine pyrophosphate-binding protein [Spirochaetaceae bacterium]|nr:MAG: thiamine pyrophosphate-binding protein [Spirochaetaceae bacterium]
MGIDSVSRVLSAQSATERARCIHEYEGIARAVSAGALQQFQRVSVSEALVLGLLNQGIRKYICVFGHGSTDIADVLASYQDAGVVQTYNVRHEIEAAHCATMLRWHYGETAAVITSIGPGALQALAGSLAASSNGIGVYHIYGDETTHDEGPNMQQIPRHEQAGFLSLVKTMGHGYQIHTPQAVFAALRRGAATVFNPVFAGPFYLLMPMNVQPTAIEECNLLEFPGRPEYPTLRVDDEQVFAQATQLVHGAQRITIKFGGGASGCGAEMVELADLIDAVIVGGAKMGGVVPYSHPRFMSVGGSKGTLCGNYAMNHADLAIVIGARAVCQWDCSGTAWKNARDVINFNSDTYDADHYNRSLLVTGDAAANLRRWIRYLRHNGFSQTAAESQWLRMNRDNKRQWEELKALRYRSPLLFDRTWGREVLTQPAAIRAILQFAGEHNAVCYFDAGDVQANGFQIAEDEVPGRTFSETGASYMGFAVSALLAAAAADRPEYTFALSGDGSFTMNPQILIDGVQHGVKGCVVILDNRAMAAITGLQYAQYGREHATRDTVVVDYAALAASVRGVNALTGGFSPQELLRALQQAYDYPGLSVIHLPVYQGPHEMGGLGAFGSWNVGNWCEQVQEEHHRLGL